MKKLITLFISIAIFTVANATTFYVDNINGNDANDGLTWATSLKSITGAIAKAKTAPYDVTVDDIFVKGGNYLTSAKIAVEYDNLYGGFAGTETSPDQRQLEDKDGNGIVEPWEFKYPSVITSTFDATGSYAFYVSNTTNTFKTAFNGFTISQSGIVKPNDNTKTYQVLKMMSANAILQNMIIDNCNVQFPSVSTTTTINGIVVDVAGGLVKNCLIEKNTIYIGFVNGSNTGIGPILQILKGTIDGCVFRNNKVTFQAVGPAATAGATYSIQGAIISFRTSSVGTDVCLNNSLIYNNEAAYDNNAANITGNQWAAVANNGGLIKIGYVGTPAATDTVVGCVIANNKMTNLGGYTLYVNSSTTKFTNIFNNVLWGNINESGAKNLYMLSSFATGTSNIGYCLNNCTSASGPTNTANGWIANNLTDLSLTNTDAKGPQFKSPTGIIGVNRVAGSTDSIAIAHANWQLNQGSYLIGKGVTLTTRTKDFSGNTFSTSRSIGAYDYNGPSGISNPIIKSDIVNVGIQKITCNTGGTIYVFNTTGKSMLNKKVQPGDEIKIQSGLYLIYAETENGNYTQKIIIQ
jgi:hypothetical protein